MSVLEIIVFVVCLVVIVGMLGFVSVYSAKNDGQYHGEDKHWDKHRWK